MQPIKSISIPTPCPQSWQQMTPIDNGRHCQSCCKTVMDFTAMSNADVIAYLASHKNTCGRFDPAHLASLNNTLIETSRTGFSWKSLVAAVSLMSIGSSLQASSSATNPPTEQLPYKLKPSTEFMPGDTSATIDIKGVIKASDDKLPLIGVNMGIKGSHTGTQTDVRGDFNLRNAPLGGTLEIRYIGYKAIEMIITPNMAQSLEIVLEPQYGLMGEVVVVRYPWYKRWWHKVKRIF